MVAMALGILPLAHADPLVVSTAQGKAHGKPINEGKARAFLGLPYAAPPVGNLRWHAPQPPERWRGTREAVHFASRCMQGNEYGDMVFQDGGPSEDCLYLNVYTPAEMSQKSRLPVMFWIHGGGYRGGSASEDRHNGDFLPTKGVVLVTINYRLGVFGFLATPELALEAGGAAGNYGLMDMVAALQWVKANIAQFGGNPDNVTIFGESAGSYAVCTLMAAAPARGLFHKAIGESGGARNVGGPSLPSRLEVEQRDRKWAAALAPNLAELRKLPADEILDAAEKKGAPNFRPVVDGHLLTEPVAATYAGGRQAHVPLLAGWNRDERSSLGDGMTAARWKAYAEKKFGARAAEFLALYPGETDARAERSAIDYDSDSFIAFGTWRWIEAQVKTGGEPVYRYHFTLAAPPSKFHAGSFAFHSDDIEYVFGTLDTRPEADWRPEDRRLSEQMMTYWTNFARTGDPNGEGLPEWPKYSSTGQIMRLTSTPIAVPDRIRSRYEFLLSRRPGGKQE